MMFLGFLTLDLCWRNALAAIPLAIAVALICRCMPCRPSTRHALWLLVLLSLLAPPVVPRFDISESLAGLMPQSEAVLSDSSEQGKRQGLQQSVAPVDDNAANSTISHVSDSSESASQVSFHDARSTPALAPAPAFSVPASSHDCAGASNQIAFDSAMLQQSANILSLISANEMHEHSATNPDLCVGHSSSDACASVEGHDPAFFDLMSLFVTSPWLPASGTNTSGAIPANQPPYAASVLPQVADAIPVADSSDSAKAVEANASSAWLIQWQQWFAGVLAVRDSIARLSPIPASFWIGGCVVILLVGCIRTLRFRRLLARAEAASANVQLQVAETSRMIGLRTAPQTLVCDACISPMVWCGRRCILLLPRSLWENLDDISRSAVLLHELAHLRRRDHWVRWAELLIGSLYWWHPVVWFVRRKLRDEADFCCDAWVTSLLPAGRHAYASALLATRKYISESRYPVPAVGLGMANNRTKRFARRLTMVMTQRNSPRLSALGGGMVLCLAVGAWLTTPLWACPPDKESKQACETTAKSKGTAVIVRPSQAPHPQADDATTFERHMAERERQRAMEQSRQSAPMPRMRTPSPQGQHEGDAHLHQRIERLENRLDRLSEHLERLFGPGSGAQPRPGAQGFGGAPGQPMLPSRSPAAIAPARPSMPAPPAHPAPPAPPALSLPRGAAQAPLAGGGMMQPRGQALAELRAFAAAEGQTITRIYHLPEGKREALYQLMAREDVPVLVSEHPEGIQVQALPHQHEVFGAFVGLIHPQSGEARGLLRAPMAAGIPQARALRAEELRGTVEAARRAAQAGGQARRQQVETLRRSMIQQRGEMERQIRELHRRAEELDRKARELERQSERLQSQADDMEEGSAKDELLMKLASIEAEMEMFEHQAELHEDEAENIEALVDELHSEFEEVVDEAQFESEEDVDAVVEEAVAAAEAAAEKAAAAEEADGDDDPDRED